VALTASEYLGTVVPGFVTDSSGNLVLTTEPAAEVFGTVIPGFLTDADGRLVATYTPAEEVRTVVPGFVTDADGRLAIATEVASPIYTQTPGFLTNADGYLSVQETPTSGVFVTGFIRDTDGALGVGATYVASPYEAAVMDLAPSIFLPLSKTAPLTDLSGNSRNGTAAGGLTAGGYTPGPLTSGDNGATDFDGTDDRITTTYATRRNLWINPTFETNVTGLSGSNATLAQSSTQAYNGTNSCRLTSTAAGAAAVITSTTAVAASPAVQYTFSFYLYHTVASRQGRAALRFYDSGGTIIGSAYLGTASATTQNAWTRFSVTATSPALTAYVGLVAYCDATNAGAAAELSYIDGLLIEAASSAGTFFPTTAQLASGEAGWTGTANASASDIGCFSSGTSRTLMGWVYRDATTNADVIFSAVTSDSSARSYLRLASGGTGVEWSWSNSPVTLTGAAIPAGAWTHWALVRTLNTGTVTFYVNGVEAYTGSPASPAVDMTGMTWTGLQIGVRAATSDPFDGKQAWVSAHQRALTAGEILAAYTAGIT